MKVLEMEMRRVRLPLRRPLTASHGTEFDRRVLILRVVVETGDGRAEGWGECSALSEPTYLADYLAGSESLLVDHVAPRLLGAESVSVLDEPGAPLDEVLPFVGHPTARAAVESALTDAALRLGDRSLAEHLGITRATVPLGVTLGLMPDDDLVAAALAGVGRGAVRVKIKVGPDTDPASVAAVRRELPDSVAVHVDANGSFDRSSGAQVDALVAAGATLVEQPLPADDLVGSAELQARLGTAADIALDESISSVGVLETVARLGAARVVSLKPARMGGVDRSVEVLQRAESLGLSVLVGGFWESGVGRSVATVLAAHDAVDRVGDIGPTSDYLDEDIVTEEAVDEAGAGLRPWTGPGNGPGPDADRLRRSTERSELWARDRKGPKKVSTGGAVGSPPAD